MEKVLIVDDEVDICYFLLRNINKQNFLASYVNTLGEARVVLDKQRPNILLLDNHLQDGFGADFAIEVKKNYPAIKIVMITAHDTENDRSLAINNGIDYFLSKPFMMADVFKAINTVSNMA
jgi:two-component system, OmpR family, response regulator